MSVEYKLLLRCLIVVKNPKAYIEDVKNFAKEANWNCLVTNAFRHGVAPLLYYNLKKSNAEYMVPADVIEELRKAYYTSMSRGIRMYQELNAILSAFKADQIKVIVLKGAALAETVYPDLAIRPFSDIDLLIPQKDLPKIETKLFQLGYAPLLPDFRPGFAQQFGVVLCYSKRSSISVSLELHWHIAISPYSNYISIDHLWRSAVPTNIAGVDTLVLSKEDLLIHLCLHASKHYYSWLLWLVDISEIIHHCGETFDWNLLLEKIQRYRICLPVRYTLWLVKKLFDAPLPSFVLEQLNSYKPSAIESRIYAILTNPDIPAIKWSLVTLLMLNGIVPKMRYLFSKLFPSRNFILKKYPNKTFFSSYCLRLSEGIICAYAFGKSLVL